MIDKKVVTRFAPSPTGFLHIGAYRTAIFSYLFARRNDGEFILRIEDTDFERNKKEFEDDIIESLKWLGISYNHFYRQSEHMERHKELLLKMINDGFAYISKEEAKDGSGLIKEIVRFKNPNKKVSFTDEIKGIVTMDTTDLGDFVIARNIQEPLFHLAVVVDDFDEGVTHVIRGEDHVSNTPRQILIQEAIGAPTPVYAHLPLVLGEDKLKLSKRRGVKAVSEYRNLGYLPESILNGATFIGWNPGTPKEVYTHNELVLDFDLSRVSKSPAVFNEEKLRWFNKEHIKRLSQTERDALIVLFLPETITSNKNFNTEVFNRAIPTIVEHIEIFSDIKKMSDNKELNYLFGVGDYDPKKLLFKGEAKKENVLECLNQIKNILLNISDFSREKIEKHIFEYVNTLSNRGIALHALRFALTGLDQSPDPFTVTYIIGKEETDIRINTALNKIDNL